MDHCRVGQNAKIHRGVVDRYNFIEEGEVITADTPDVRPGAVVDGDLIALPRGRTRPI